MSTPVPTNTQEVFLGLTIQFCLAVASGSVCIGLFEYMRRKRPAVYAPKYHSDKPRSVRFLGEKYVKLLAKIPN